MNILQWNAEKFLKHILDSGRNGGYFFKFHVFWCTLSFCLIFVGVDKIILIYFIKYSLLVMVTNS